jgi:hypothetical protein
MTNLLNYAQIAVLDSWFISHQDNLDCDLEREWVGISLDLVIVLTQIFIDASSGDGVTHHHSNRITWEAGCQPTAESESLEVVFGNLHVWKVRGRFISLWSSKDRWPTVKFHFNITKDNCILDLNLVYYYKKCCLQYLFVHYLCWTFYCVL